MPSPSPSSTRDPAYAHRLQQLSARDRGLRRFVDLQRPYRWNVRHLQPGFVLDIGCGIGRNLNHLYGLGVGVDHNAECVAACRTAGLRAFEPAAFAASEFAVADRFDTMLLAHVVEHMTEAEADDVITEYRPFIRPEGRVILITPQERGQASDATHVRFVDQDAVRRMAQRLNLQVVSISSFPFPRSVGRVFTYNETVSILSARREG